MKIKTVTIENKTYAVLSDDGKPVYVHDDGREIPFDAPGTVSTIARLTEESKGFKTRAQTAETKVATFEGIEDPEAARKALKTVANLDEKKLIDAGKVEEIKAAAIAAVEEKYKPIVGERDKLKGDIDGLVRGNAFKGSKFITDKVAVPPHMLEKTFGDRFKVEDGKLVPYDANGNKVFSRVKPGEVAEFDEAIELTIAADPYKDSILKGATGGGGSKGGGGHIGGAKTFTRQEFDALPANDRIAKMKDGYKVVDAA